MLQEVLGDDDFLQVSSARRLVNMTGTAIDLEFSQAKEVGLHIGMERSKVAPPLQWWQKWELNQYLRNQVG
jgi:hypothetical protein